MACATCHAVGQPASIRSALSASGSAMRHRRSTIRCARRRSANYFVRDGNVVSSEIRLAHAHVGQRLRLLVRLLIFLAAVAQSRTTVLYPYLAATRLAASVVAVLVCPFAYRHFFVSSNIIRQIIKNTNVQAIVIPTYQCCLSASSTRQNSNLSPPAGTDHTALCFSSPSAAPAIVRAPCAYRHQLPSSCNS